MYWYCKGIECVFWIHLHSNTWCRVTEWWFYFHVNRWCSNVFLFLFCLWNYYSGAFKHRIQLGYKQISKQFKAKLVCAELSLWCGSHGVHWPSSFTEGFCVCRCEEATLLLLSGQKKSQHCTIFTSPISCSINIDRGFLEERLGLIMGVWVNLKQQDFVHFNLPYSKHVQALVTDFRSYFI